MKVILGIGNHGKEYDGTRHNAGFAVVDRLAAAAGLQFELNKRWETLVSQWRCSGLFESEDDKVLLLKPQTYVNLSGKTAQAVCAYYKIDPTDLLVVVDDINLKLGDLRLRAQGSSGGHNGLKDIERRLGRAYPRLRLGVGAPQGNQLGHVLGKFAPEERDDAHDMLNKATDCCRVWLTEGTDTAMRFNGPLRPPPPRPKPQQPEPSASVDSASPTADSAAAADDAAPADD